MQSETNNNESFVMQDYAENRGDLFSPSLLQVPTYLKSNRSFFYNEATLERLSHVNKRVVSPFQTDFVTLWKVPLLWSDGSPWSFRWIISLRQLAELVGRSDTGSFSKWLREHMPEQLFEFDNYALRSPTGRSYKLGVSYEGARDVLLHRMNDAKYNSALLRVFDMEGSSDLVDDDTISRTYELARIERNKQRMENQNDYSTSSSVLLLSSESSHLSIASEKAAAADAAVDQDIMAQDTVVIDLCELADVCSNEAEKLEDDNDDHDIVVEQPPPSFTPLTKQDVLDLLQPMEEQVKALQSLLHNVYDLNVLFTQDALEPAVAEYLESGRGRNLKKRMLRKYAEQKQDEIRATVERQFTESIYKRFREDDVFMRDVMKRLFDGGNSDILAGSGPTEKKKKQKTTEI